MEIDWLSVGLGDDKYDAINRAIAEQLGYRVEKRKHTIALIRPDGSERIGFGSEDAAWWNVPQFSREVEPALTLWNTLDTNWTPRLVRLLSPRGEITFSFKACFLNNTSHDQVEREAATPALAICRAWLVLQELLKIE